MAAATTQSRWQTPPDCRRFAEPSYPSLLATDYQMFREIAAEPDLGDWLDATS